MQDLIPSKGTCIDTKVGTCVSSAVEKAKQVMMPSTGRGTGTDVPRLNRINTYTGTGMQGL